MLYRSKRPSPNPKGWPKCVSLALLLLLSRFSHVRLCVTPQTAAHQAPPRPWDSPSKNTGVGCHFLPQCRKVKSESEDTQSCPTLHDPMDCSPPGSSVHGIFQARTLEWVAISFSNAGKWKVKGKTLGRVRLLATPCTAALQAPPPWDFPGRSTGVGRHRLLWLLSHSVVFVTSRL